MFKTNKAQKGDKKQGTKSKAHHRIRASTQSIKSRHYGPKI